MTVCGSAFHSVCAAQNNKRQLCGEKKIYIFLSFDRRINNTEQKL